MDPVVGLRMEGNEWKYLTRFARDRLSQLGPPSLRLAFRGVLDLCNRKLEVHDLPHLVDVVNR
jgi:hypothetical protein